MTAVDDAEAEIHQLIDEMIVQWNACEGRLRDMVIWLSGGRSVATLALTAHMTAKALTDALPALTGSKSAEVREHFEHYSKAVDILRDYRNYYVHGISLVSRSVINPDPLAWVSQITGRMRVKIHHDLVGVDVLRPIRDDMMRFNNYGYAIQ
jgi:hypothetical protein